MDANSLKRIVDDPASTAAERAAAQRQLDTLTGQAPSSPVTGHTPASPDRMILSADVRFMLEIGDALGDHAMLAVCRRWNRDPQPVFDSLYEHHYQTLKEYERLCTLNSRHPNYIREHFIPAVQNIMEHVPAEAVNTRAAGERILNNYGKETE